MRAMLFTVFSIFTCVAQADANRAVFSSLLRPPEAQAMAIKIRGGYIFDASDDKLPFSSEVLRRNSHLHNWMEYPLGGYSQRL
jgi:hypothetical protein